MRARFVTEDPKENRESEAFGYVFPVGEWVEVSGLAASKLRGNPMFEVDGNEDGAVDPDPAELKAQLDALGIKYHHKAGAVKLQELLDEHAATPVPEPEPPAPEDEA